MAFPQHNSIKKEKRVLYVRPCFQKFNTDCSLNFTMNPRIDIEFPIELHSISSSINWSRSFLTRMHLREVVTGEMALLSCPAPILTLDRYAFARARLLVK